MHGEGSGSKLPGFPSFSTSGVSQCSAISLLRTKTPAQIRALFSPCPPPGRYLRRHRMELSDPDAFARGELAELVESWVWYIDPATPEEWIPERAYLSWFRYGSAVLGIDSAWDPHRMTEGISDDPVRAAELGMRNLRIAHEQILEWVLDPSQAQGRGAAYPGVGEALDPGPFPHHPAESYSGGKSYPGGMRKAHRGPVARASLASRVARGASRTSAKAT